MLFRSGATAESLLKIGNDFTVGTRYTLTAGKGTECIIGRDCMFSMDIILMTNDGSHSIFDVETRKNINSTREINKKRKIIIGNHVWVGIRATILYNTLIGDGSIIGAESLVKNKIPNNCIAAGNPAKVIKKNIAWCRAEDSKDIGECGEALFILQMTIYSKTVDIKYHGAVGYYFGEECGYYP